MRKQHLAGALLLLISNSCLAVANLEFTRQEALKKDFFAQTQISLDGEKGNHNSLDAEVSSMLSWHEGSTHFMLLGEYEWGERNDEINANESFIHIRYAKSIPSSDHAIELFGQAKTEKFQALASRTLAGAGYRFATTNELNKRFNAFGVGAFYETEKGAGPEDGNDSEAWRANLYWHHSRPAGDSTTIQNVIYLQPGLNDISDIRIYDELRMTTRVSERFSYGLSLVYSYDSEPFESVEDYEFQYGTFLVYRF